MATPEFGSTNITDIAAKFQEQVDELRKVDFAEQERKTAYFTLQDERDLARTEVERLKDAIKKLEDENVELLSQVEASKKAEPEPETVEESL